MTLSPTPRHAAPYARRALFLLTALATATLTGFGARQAQATVYYVATTGSNFNTGLSWSSPKSDLQATIHAAASGDQVWVKTGTYASNDTATDGVAVYGGFAGTETSVAQRSIAAHPTILNGGGTGAVYTIPGAATQTNTLDGFTVQNGIDGGGIYDTSSDTLVVSNCVFSNNRGYGGGIDAQYGTNIVTNCTFTGNAASDGGGIEAGHVATITGCAFTSNTAFMGGGIYAQYSKAAITNCSFTSNAASSGDGGGIDAGTGTTVFGCTFTNDSASQVGGGVYTLFDATAVMDCSFKSDTPDAVYSYSAGSSTAPTLIKDCLIVGNGTSASGADGIDVDTGNNSDTSYITIANNTIVGTSVGIKFNAGSGAIDVANNIFDGNYGGLSDTGIATFISSHNDNYGNLNFNYQGVNPSASDLSVNPAFVNAASGNYRLAAGSPLIDAGDDTFVITGDKDLDGNPRIQGGHVDLGAYESAPVYPWYATAVSAAPSGVSHILWTKADGVAGLWTLNANGVETAIGPTYGPFPGYAAVAVASAPDGTSRVLWTNGAGQAVVWTFNAADVKTIIGPTYGPYSGWSAKAVGVAGDGTSRVLWDNTNGMAGVWSFNAADVNTVVGKTYGPFPGWSAKSLATATDGTSRVLWDNTNGDAGVWTFSAADTETAIGPTYGPFTGWSAKAVGVAGDGTSRVLWTNVNGKAGIWSFSTSDINTVVGPTYGPYAGYTATSLGVATDNTSRVLWDNTSRAAGVWSFTPSDYEKVIGPTYGPY